MAWVMDTYSMHVGHTSTAVVTGKPIEMGGSLGRREATGRGVMIAARESANHVGLNIKGAKVAVQGFGNVGSISADCSPRSRRDHRRRHRLEGRHLQRQGARHPCAARLCEAAQDGRRVLRRRTAAQRQPFSLDVDILIPAALENQITIDNAPSIKAKIIIEGANGPTTPDAHKYLHEHGVFVVPDIPRQQLRRHDVLLRVGAGSVRVFLDREGSQRTARSQDVRGVHAVLRLAEVQGRHAHGRLHRRDQPRRHRHADARDVRVRHSCQSSVVGRQAIAAGRQSYDAELDEFAQSVRHRATGPFA
jgi:Glutamate dehydrogenase/leucine dehydrogenase